MSRERAEPRGLPLQNEKATMANSPALPTPSLRVARAEAARHAGRLPIHHGVTSGFGVERYFLTTVGKSQRVF